MTDVVTTIRPRRGIGESPTRPDGTAKVQGRFAFSSDIGADGMACTRVGFIAISAPRNTPVMLALRCMRPFLFALSNKTVRVCPAW